MSRTLSTSPHRQGTESGTPEPRGFRGIGATDPQSMQKALQAEAIELQREMERIRERRRLLDEQRKLLENRSSRMLTPAPGGSGRSTSMRSTSSHARHFDLFTPIPSERERCKTQVPTEQLEMKEAMKESWQRDSTLVGGYFLLKDNSKIPTISREQRFRPIIGMKGQYYLANDIFKMQATAKAKRREVFDVSVRGKKDCNVVNNWNDSRGGCAPGPGAYTPRFQKVAPPSALAAQR